MNRKQIIEAMAHNDGLGPCQAGAILDTLETAIPGLADVIRGEAVIVPIPPTEAMIEAGKLRVLEKYLSPRATAYQSFRAMIEARPTVTAQADPCSASAAVPGSGE